MIRSASFLLSGLHDCLGRVAFDQHALNGKAIKLRPERLVQVFPASSNDLREHIPTSELGAVLRHTGGVAQRRHDVQHHDLRMEMAGQCRSLMNHTQRRIREINRKKNLLNIQHRAPAEESKCPFIFLRAFPA